MRGLPRLLAFLAGSLLAGTVLAGSLAGRVTDAAGQPVVRAQVVCFAFRTPERRLLEKTRSTEPAPILETKTDSNGRFVASIPKPDSDVSLRIIAEGLPSSEIEGPFDLATENEELEILLPAAEPISGRVVDEAGKPLSGVLVRADSIPSFSAGDGAAFGEAKTGPDGTFMVKGAPAGAGVLRASLAGFAPSTVPAKSKAARERIVMKRGGSIGGTVLDPTGKPAAGALVVATSGAAETDEAGRYRIEALAEGTIGVQATVREELVARREGLKVRAGETVQADLILARSASIVGSVVDEKTRRPIAGALVVASEARQMFIVVAGGPRAWTDARGRFRIAGLVARDYSIVASRRDYVQSQVPGVLAAESPSRRVDLALRRSLTISGRVTDEQGQPVAGARIGMAAGVGWRALMNRRFPRSRAATTSGADGTFRLRGLVPDPAASIVAEKAGFVAARRDGIPLLAEGAKGVALVLKRGLQAKGRVVNEAGQPVPGVEVTLSRNERFDAAPSWTSTNEPDSVRPAVVTDADGRFFASALSPGEYVIRFTRAGFATKTLPLEVREEPVNEWADVVLRGEALIAGIVRNTKGEPVAGANISSRSDGTGTTPGPTVSDPEGRFRLEGFAAGASVSVNVTASGFAHAQRTIRPPAADVAIALSTAATIRGRIEDADSKQPIPSFSIQCETGRSSSQRSSIRRDFQSPDGAFELSDVAPGRIDLSGSAPGYVEGGVTGIEIGEGETRDGIVLAVKRGRTVTGRVIDAARGAGVPNATVGWREEGRGDGRGTIHTAYGVIANLPNSTTTDADGGFRHEGLPSGRLVFVAVHPDYLEASKALDTASGSSVDLTLSTGGSIAGQVLGRDGRTPVGGAVVALEEQGAAPSSRSTESARTDPAGRFEFPHLKEGRYRISARDSTGRTGLREVVLAPEQRVADVSLEFVGGTLVRGRVSGLAAESLSAVRINAFTRGYQTSAAVGEDGQFLLRDVPSGVLRVSAWAGVSSQRSTSKSVEIPEGAAEASVEVVFEGGSRLSGRVLRGEKAIPGVFVNGFPEPLSSGPSRASAQTDESGRYVLEGIADGPTRVSVSAQGINASRLVTVSGDTVFDVVIRGTTLSGTVTDAATGDPLQDAEVRAQAGSPNPSGGGRSALSDSRGRYVLEDLDADSYQVTVQRRGYQQKTRTAVVEESPAELDIAIARGEGLSIRAADGLTRIPLRSVYVVAVTPDKATAFLGVVSLDSSGGGEVSLAPGTYSLHVGAAGYASRFVQVEVPSPPLVLWMTPGGTVEVRVSAPVSGRIVDGAGAPYSSNPWRQDGFVNIAPPLVYWEHFPTGSYRLVVPGPDGEKSYPFTVAEGKTTQVEIR